MEQPQNELFPLMLTRQELTAAEISVLRDIQRLTEEYKKLAELTNSPAAELSHSMALFELSGIVCKIRAALYGIKGE